MRASTYILLAATSFCMLSKTAAANDLPAGFSELQAAPNTAIEIEKRQVFPGFVVFQGLEQWRDRGAESVTFTAMLLLVTCSGEVNSINMEVSKESYSEALLKLAGSIPANTISPVSIPGLNTERAVVAASKESCKSKKSSSKSSIEIPISTSHNEIISVLARSIIVSGKSREAWLTSRQTREEQSRLPDGQPLKLSTGQNVTYTVIEKDGKSSKSHVSVNCPGKTMTTFQLIRYTEGGQVLSQSSVDGGRAIPSGIVPGTVGESIFNYLCAL